MVPFEEFPFPQKVEPNTIYIPHGNDYPYHWDNPYYHVAGVNDRIAYGDVDSMRIYSNVYEKIDEYCSNGRPYHPESLVLHHLESNGLKIQRFPFQFCLHSDRHAQTSTQ